MLYMRRRPAADPLPIHGDEAWISPASATSTSSSQHSDHVIALFGIASNAVEKKIDRCGKVLQIPGYNVFENHGDDENGCSEDEDVRSEGHDYAGRRHGGL